MATVKNVIGLAMLAGCGDLVGFGGEVPPLATLQLEVTGDIDSVRQQGADGEHLRLAVVWGAQWLSETTCTTVPDTSDTALITFLLTGCRNPFMFTPDRVGDSIEIVPNEPAVFPINNLPGGDVFVGTLSARVAYASLVVFDDRDGTGKLELGVTQRPPIRDNRGYQEDDGDAPNPMQDIIYGASFVAMTEADTRLAFREGGWNLGAAFYPRNGCGEPLPRFSVLSAGGFSLLDAYNTAQTGEIPMQDPATCKELPPDEAAISIALRAPTYIRETACRQRSSSGNVSYRMPPFGPIDFTDRSYLCRKVPNTEVMELMVTQRTSDPCRGITHYVLRGCDDGNDLDCALPEWDLTETPPDWWPCGAQQ